MTVSEGRDLLIRQIRSDILSASGWPMLYNEVAAVLDSLVCLGFEVIPASTLERLDRIAATAEAVTEVAVLEPGDEMFDVLSDLHDAVHAGRAVAGVAEDPQPHDGAT